MYCYFVYVSCLWIYYWNNFVFFSPSQNSLFLQVSFHLFIFDSVFHVWGISQRFADLGCLPLFKNSASESCSEALIPWWSLLFPQGISNQLIESCTLDRVITEKRLPIVDGEGLVPLSGRCLGENISLQCVHLLNPVIMERSPPALTALWLPTGGERILRSNWLSHITSTDMRNLTWLCLWDENVSPWLNLLIPLWLSCSWFSLFFVHSEIVILLVPLLLSRLFLWLSWL